MVTKREILDHEARGGRSVYLRRKYNQQLIGGGEKISKAQIFNALERFHGSKKGNPQWKNTRSNSITNSNTNGDYHDGGGIVGSFSGQLGFVRSWTDSFATLSTLSRTKHGTELCKILGKFMQQKYPKFHFTSICVNRNWPGTLHVDKNNLGPSKMLTVGSNTLQGGDLYIHTLSGGGKLIKTQNRVVTFNGNDPHMTQPYHGTRYSIVFYTTSSGIKPDRRKQLKKMYFNPPASRSSVSLETRTKKPVKVRMELAVDNLKRKYPSLYRTYQRRQGGKNEQIRKKFRKNYKQYHHLY